MENKGSSLDEKMDSKNEILAVRIKKRSSKTKNKLESLLNMRFTKTLPYQDKLSLDDFPVFTEYKLKRRLIFGSFKLRMCKSYIEQIHEYGRIYFLNEDHYKKFIDNTKVRDDLKFSRVIALTVGSKHKRGKKWLPDDKKKDLSADVDPKIFNTYYKVFIQYVPNNENTLSNERNPCKRIKRK
jgi:hypothetical protein